MFRALRRFILKKFGGVRRFVIFLTCTGIILYCLHSLLSSDSPRQVWDVQTYSLNLSTEDGCSVSCSLSQHSFYVRTGDKNVAGPTICFDGNIIVSNELKNFGRGLTVVLAKGKGLKSTEVKSFDTYVEDTTLIRFLKKDVPDGAIIIVASYDEASFSLKEDARRWLKTYGSSAIDNLNFRDSFILIGQKGLKEGHAIEYISKKDKAEDFSTALEKAGCFSLPLGPQGNLQMALPDVIQGPAIILGESMPFCGMATECPADHVSIAVYTGEENTKQPWICVHGHIVMAENLNKGGRGFNIVTVSSETLLPVSTMHADTYTSDSTDLELYLESLSHGDIVVAVVADDAAKKLSYSARELWNHLGSGYIQNLHFRDVWYFIGQKGINGFSTMEKISYAGFDGGWPRPLKQSFCVPRTLTGRKIVPDPEFYRFDERREFCKNYDGYPEFCDPSHIDDQLKVVGVADKELRGHAIFDTPLIIVPGMNHNALVRTLETTLMQPGVKQESVVVMWDEKFKEYGELASLFGFRNSSLPSSTRYMEQMGHALKEALKMFPQAEHFIVVEEELLLSPDYLSFLAQCMSVLNSDASLVGVSAWNFNGFEKTSGNRSVVYRVEDFPGLGFLIKKNALSLLSETFDDCCSKRAWHGWDFQENHQYEILMPDVSRVFRQPYLGTGHQADFLAELFLQPRVTSLQSPVVLQDLGNLMEKEYEEYLHQLIKSSTVLSSENLHNCVRSIEPPPDLSTEDKKPVAVYFEQDSATDFRLLREISRCFGLMSPRTYRPKNLHNGMLRFWYQDHHIFLIGSSTPYYINKPVKIDPIMLTAS